MCIPYQWDLCVTPWYEVLKQRMGAASAPSHHYWCGAFRGAGKRVELSPRGASCELNHRFYGPDVEGWEAALENQSVSQSVGYRLSHTTRSMGQVVGYST